MIISIPLHKILINTLIEWIDAAHPSIYRASMDSNGQTKTICLYFDFRNECICH